MPVDPTKLRIQDGRHFIDELMGEGLNKNTIAGYTYGLRAYAQINGNDALDGLAEFINHGPKYKSLTAKEVSKLLDTKLQPELEIVLHLMLFFGGSEKDLTRIKVSDIDFEKETVTLRPLPGYEGPRVQDFVTMANGRTSREVFEEYLAFRHTLVKWVRFNNKDAADPEELLIYDMGLSLLPFNEESTSMTNRLREISKVAGIRLTEGLLLKTYSRNLTYSERSSEELRSLTTRKANPALPQEAS